jgi:uncharacterized protein (DUF2147 family)
MKKNTCTFLFLFVTSWLMTASAWAQMTPVGTWQSVDDDTKQITAEITIKDSLGIVSGSITKFLRPGADLTRLCDKCNDDRKDKPMLGMEIIRGAKKIDGKDIWEGGKILDPDNGSSYKLRLTPIEGGRKLEVRGSFLFISRTQIWQRIN